MTNVAKQLLDAHVAHELSELEGPALTRLIEERVRAVFRWLEDVKCNDVCSSEQIAGVIDRYVIELRISGGITELAGEMSNVVLTSELAATTRLEDVCSSQSYEAFSDKIANLAGVRRLLVHSVVGTSAFASLAGRVLAQAIANLFISSGSPSTGNRLRQRAVALRTRLLPGAERRVAVALSHYIERRIEHLPADEERALETFDPDRVRQVADEIWDEISQKPLAEVFAFLSATDLEDFVVLGYEFWLKFRKTPYFRAISREIVNRLFDKYGDESVVSVIDDMGVSQEMVAEELRTLLGPILEEARSSGFLEQQIRARLESFYRSEAAQTIFER